MNTAQEFRQAIEQAGLTPPPTIIPDGKLHRFPTNGHHDDSGWYVLHSDGIPAGEFGDWRTDLKQKWCAKLETKMTAKERAAHTRRVAALQRVRQQEEKQAHAAAAKRAQQIWSDAKPATADHPYLKRKHVKPNGLRVDADNRLLVPVMIGGSIASLQTIDANGGKQFLSGGKVKGGSCTIGEMRDAAIIGVGEGFSTCASVNEATDYPTACAFSAGNLTPVAEQLREQCPTATIYICGDNDYHIDGKPNTGLLAATAAAEAVKGLVVIPDAINNTKTDWNDVYVQRGRDAVREAIESALKREQETEAMIERWRILDDVYLFLGKFVAYPSEPARIAHCLWVAHTHLMDAWESTPRLAFLSPEPGSGKTRALELTETLVPRPIEAINVTSAYLFRKISDRAGLPTVLHDEIDTIFGKHAKDHEEIRGVINAGHRRGASAGRCVVKGKLIETEELPAFCAVAMAGLGNLPDTILTRSVIIKMRRRAPGEVVEPYRRRVHAPEGYKLRDRLAYWAKQIRSILDTYPPMPVGITDRNADVWESLLSVADAAGGDWPDRARVAAVASVAAAIAGTPSLGVLLLRDIRTVFGDRDSLWTAELLPALINLEESPWGDLKGKPLDATRLAYILKPYGITSTQVRIGDKNQRGYFRQAFQDAWLRYVPPVESALGVPPIAGATAATNATSDTSGLSNSGVQVCSASGEIESDEPDEVLDLDF